MNNVVALRRPNSAPDFAKNDGRAFDLNFFLGVTVFGVLPQVVAISYYGLLLAGILGVSTLAGIGLGFAIRRFFPYRLQTLAINSSTQLQFVSETIAKKAA